MHEQLPLSIVIKKDEFVVTDVCVIFELLQPYSKVFWFGNCLVQFQDLEI